jgi:hypothetical protein
LTSEDDVALPQVVSSMQNRRHSISTSRDTSQEGQRWELRGSCDDAICIQTPWWGLLK